jgi:hypothetical protein
MVDTNMEKAYLWACELLQPYKLPISLEEIQNRTDLIRKINDLIINQINKDLGFGGNGLFEHFDYIKKSNLLKDIAQIVEEDIPNETNANIRINVSLRLWSGCIDAAKTIALKTNEGAVTSQYRKLAFIFIDNFAKRDLIYCRGVESAPIYKRSYNEPVSFNGVPIDSPVRKYQ